MSTASVSVNKQFDVLPCNAALITQPRSNATGELMMRPPPLDFALLFGSQFLLACGCNPKADAMTEALESLDEVVGCEVEIDVVDHSSPAVSSALPVKAESLVVLAGQHPSPR
ncbi:hypothetical protein BJL96_27505 [Burkholderia cenocepacia]|nr:hypothetical protein [Burkholderia cenocepacia]